MAVTRAQIGAKFGSKIAKRPRMGRDFPLTGDVQNTMGWWTTIFPSHSYDLVRGTFLGQAREGCTYPGGREGLQKAREDSQRRWLRVFGCLR